MNTEQINNPKVSIIIPTYNRANYIGETIESVLSQTYKDFEIIIVDDGSTDRTKNTIHKYNSKIKYLYQSNKGTPAARNFGISKSSGEYIAFIDDDDLWLPEKLEKQIAIIEANQRIGFVCSAVYKIDGENNYIETWTRNKNVNHMTFESLYERNFVYNLTVLIRKKCIKEVGGLDESLLVSQDYDLWLRVAKKYKFYYIDIPLAKWRIHENNLSKNLDMRLQNHKTILNKMEITKNINFTKHRVRLGKLHYEFAKEYVAKGNFYKAGLCYFKSTLMYPFIGYYYWPKETENFKCSLPYRIVNVYLLGTKYIFKHIITRTKGKILLPTNKIIKQTFAKLFILFAYFASWKLETRDPKKNINIGIICEEFFHKDLRGFGGFGKTVKNISEYLNSSESIFKTKVLIPQGLEITSKPEIKRFHNTEVIIRSKHLDRGLATLFKYLQLINISKINIFISIDYYPTYEYTLLAAPSTPLIIWIKDPRGKEEWEKIHTVPLESKALNRKDKNALLKLADEKRCSIKKILNLNKLLKRRIIFVTQAKFLIERAKRTYGLANINSHLLLNPVPLSENRQIKFSKNPSFCLLGRLDPVKRPWIVFKLAKKFPQIDFYIAGKAHFQELIDPIIKKYTHLENLKFMGMLNDSEKNKILRNCWGLINTSIHEALPVSFLEALSFGKPIISCQNPDDLTIKFGFYTGELLGNGDDENTLNAFANQINNLLKNSDERIEKGLAGKNYVEKNHTFTNFEQTLQNILRMEKII